MRATRTLGLFSRHPPISVTKRFFSVAASAHFELTIPANFFFDDRIVSLLLCRRDVIEWLPLLAGKAKRNLAAKYTLKLRSLRIYTPAHMYASALLQWSPNILFLLLPSAFHKNHTTCHYSKWLLLTKPKFQFARSFRRLPAVGAAAPPTENFDDMPPLPRLWRRPLASH